MLTWKMLFTFLKEMYWNLLESEKWNISLNRIYTNFLFSHVNCILMQNFHFNISNDIYFKCAKMKYVRVCVPDFNKINTIYKSHDSFFCFDACIYLVKSVDLL